MGGSLLLINNFLKLNYSLLSLFIREHVLDINNTALQDIRNDILVSIWPSKPHAAFAKGAKLYVM